MKAELDDLIEFLGGCEPFAHLPAEDLHALPATLDMIYVRRGSTLASRGQENDQVYVIRSGAVDVLGPDDILLDRRDAERSCGYSTILGPNAGEPLRYSFVTVEDSLLIVIPRETLLDLAARFPDIERYYSSQSRRIRAAADQLDGDFSGDVLRTKISEVMVRTPVTTSRDTSIREAAQTMQEHKVSSVLVTCEGKLEGIMTDRDLRGRVVAAGLDTSAPLHTIMTPDPVVITPDTLAFEAMLTMAELNIHHLPVVESDNSTTLCGILSTPDIMRLLKHDPIYVTADLSRRKTNEELRDAHVRAGEVATRFIDRGAHPREIGQILTTAADALTRRFAVLAEDELGPPPVDYAFVVLGSHGRREMGLASDQDSALILSDDYTPAHAEYFEQLTTRICTGLDSAGLVLCPGDMMAMNSTWRKTVSEWEDTFREWVRKPEPEALLLAQVFFDMRSVHGNAELADIVHRNAVDMAVSARRMHAHLATLAANREPPLGFFRGLVVERSGDYANTLDIKKGGIAAIVQMARLFAITQNLTVLGTRERLEAAAGTSAVSKQGALDLVDAFDYLQTVAYKHQSHQLHSGDSPDYHVDPKGLPRSDRDHLRDSFHIIKSMQSALATKYPVGTIG